MQQSVKEYSEIGTQLPIGQCDGLTAGTRTFFHLMSEWTRETAQFVGRRLERHADFQMELSRCASPFEPIQCMLEFNNAAMEDYSEQFKRNASLFARESETALIDMSAQVDAVRAPAVD